MHIYLNLILLISSLNKYYFKYVPLTEVFYSNKKYLINKSKDNESILVLVLYTVLISEHESS